MKLSVVLDIDSPGCCHLVLFLHFLSHVEDSLAPNDRTFIEAQFFPREVPFYQKLGMFIHLRIDFRPSVHCILP